MALGFILGGSLLAFFTFCADGVAQTSRGQIGEITSSLRDRRFDRALQLLQSELQQNPENAQSWALQGIAYSGMSEKAKALQSFRHALEIAPNYLPALEGAAQIEYDAGGKNAEALLKRVLAQQPHNPTSHAMLAVLSYRRRDLAQARDILAKLYLQGGQTEPAMEQSRQALKIDPKDQTALYHLIQALRKNGHKEELPDLLKRLANLRTQASKDEAEHNRYKLVEEKSPSMERPQS